MPGDARKPEDRQTYYTLQALSLAQAFKWATGTLDVAANTDQPHLVLSEPTEHASAGGRLAVQYVYLVLPGRRTVIVGRAHHLENRVELRSYSFATWSYRFRHGSEGFPVAPAAYDGYLVLLEDFFLHRGFAQVVTVPCPTEGPITLEVPTVGKPSRGGSDGDPGRSR